MNKAKILLTVLYKLTHCCDCHKVDMSPFWHPRRLWAVIRHSDMAFVCRQCYKKRQKLALAVSIAAPMAAISYMLFKKYGQGNGKEILT